MKEASSNVVAFPAQTTDVLTEILLQGAQSLLLQAIQAEVGDYIDRFKDLKDASGKRLVVRNGSMPEREIQTPLGQIPVKQPRVDDRRVDASGNRLRFESKILPPYLRKTKSMEELIPWLYLKGISTSDLTDALSALLGKDAPGLSATTIGRLQEGWQKDYEKWNQRRLETSVLYTSGPTAFISMSDWVRTRGCVFSW